MKQAADRIEIEKQLHQLGVVIDGIDDHDFHIADGGRAEGIEIDIRTVQNTVGADRLAACEDSFGDAFRRGTTVVRIELDTEITLRTTGIMTGAVEWLGCP